MEEDCRVRMDSDMSKRLDRCCTCTSRVTEARETVGVLRSLHIACSL